jgi:glycerate-2-kinase
LLVTVGQENGVGGRNQEYALSAALRIAGSKNVVMGRVDTDGTDGPGGCFAADAADIPAWRAVL